MANYNLTNQTISSSFQQLLQKDTDTGTLVDGLGNVVDELIVTSSYSVTASYAENVDDPTWDSIQNKPTVVSGSSQIDYPLISNIPSGIVSSSTQITDGSGIVSGSVLRPDGDGVVSGSSQIDVTQTTNYSSINQYSDTKVKDKMNADSVVSGSYVEALPSGVVSGSSQINYPLISNIPSGIISSSEQLPSGVVSGSAQISDITGSSLTTASFASQTLTFTKGDGSTFGVNIPDVSGSDISALNAFTASQEELNTTFATTGSNAFVGPQSVFMQNFGENFEITGSNFFMKNQFSGDTTQLNGSSVLVGGTAALRTTGFQVRNENNAADIFILSSTPAAIPDYNVPTGSLVGQSGLFFNHDTDFNNVLPTNGVITMKTGSAYDGIIHIGDGLNTQIDGNLTVAGTISNLAEYATTGSNTFTGDQTINGTNVAPGNTLTVNDGNGTPRLQINNATLAGLAGADVLLNGNTLNSGTSTIVGQTLLQGGLELTGSLNSAGDVTIKGTNLAPQQTFIAKDGTGTNRLEVNNATLSGFTGVDVNINGKTQITDTLTLLGDGIVNGTNAAPVSTFVIKDGNSTNRLEVNNATLSGFTGVDVNINGKTQITDTLTTIVDVKVGTQLVLLDYANLDFANDTDAAAGGVPLGGVYHHNSSVKIRVT